MNFTILIANVGSGMGAQLAAARLLYGMGRSDALPRGFFGAIEPKRRIPMNNVLLIGAIALTGAFFITYERGVELLNFGAFIAFMGVNAAAFVRYFLRAAEKRWTNLVFPLLGFSICFFIWLNLSRPAKIAGGVWILVGIIYGAIRREDFRPASSASICPPTKRNAENKLSVGFLGDDVDIHGGGVAQKAADGIHVEQLLPAFGRRPPKDHLRDVLFAHELRGGIGDARAFQAHGLRAQAFGELHVGGESFFVARVHAACQDPRARRKAPHPSAAPCGPRAPADIARADSR